MRRILLVCAALLCAIAMLPAALAEGDGYEERATQVVAGGEPAGELTLRFYEATPNVPYMGFGAYWAYMRQTPLTLRDNGDGTCALVNDIGEAITCDPAAGTITVPDWNRFFDYPLPLENDAKGYKDINFRFVRVVDVAYEGEPEPVTLDFARYGIRLYADQDDVYLPLSILSNTMTDVATLHMRYNGDKLYALKIDLAGSFPEDLYETEAFKDLINGGERPGDVVRECYADLCFTFDYFFGHPGVAELDAALAEKGLDQALTDLGDEGVALREKLLSNDLATYLEGLSELFGRRLADGHTLFISLSEFASSESLMASLGFRIKLIQMYMESIMNSPVLINQLADELIPPQREAIWGAEPYREYGSTAIIRLDSFMPDEAAWEAYSGGDDALPEDALGYLVDGLRRASENPEIKNVIFDLSCNSGGSSDMMMMILGLTTGQDHIYGINRLTGRRMTLTYEVDANFDGVFDDSDREAAYDFNYGVLTTRHAFSCGNLFPIIMQEGGAVVIGEPTSGGSCCIQIGTDTQGFTFVLSSGQWQLIDSQGESVEGGCSVDLPIEPASNPMLDVLAGAFTVEGGLPDFTAFFDDATLDQMMNDWFADPAQASAAA